MKLNRARLFVDVIVFALIFCLTARPALNAADPGASSARPRSLAENLFANAADLGRALHDRPLEQRSLDDYRRALDAFNQVVRLNTNTYFSAESYARMAELQREMADVSGDSALYRRAIETFRRIIIEHPQSIFVGDALISIAHIYEENLQDLDGAASAYRELTLHFPDSVMARESRAVLARFESQLRDRPVDVAAPSGADARADEYPGLARLTNVRNFSGPDYARVVIDLSGEAAYRDSRAGDNVVAVSLDDSIISSSLYGRRFIVGASTMLRRVKVSGESSSGPGVRVEIETGALSDYSIFLLSAPSRLVIDLHAKSARWRSGVKSPSEALRDEEASPGETAERENAAPPARASSGGSPGVESGQAPVSRPGADARVSGKALLSLPEIHDPILPFNPAEQHSAAAPSAGVSAIASAIASELRSAGAAVKCVVIDPGHGGHDTGTIGSNGMREKDLVLDVARRLRGYIKRNYPDVEVILTRDSDRFVALEERTAIANSRRADLFISVHANASESRGASGVETYFMSPDRAPSEDLKAAARENAKFADDRREGPEANRASPVVASVRAGNRVAESRELARYIQSGLVRGIGAASPRTATNRGVKHAPFTVLLGASMPSVLAEVSFMSNPRDEALLQTSQFRERIAASLFAGLNAYLKKNHASEPGKP
ncbi:MAG TPA: N-acetylmuramoyl-L-alanine amidase [Blastocatellia bacterium]|nr:N-acetylmuramoyl-L-alanine amidase [Blastocatellia bacterium]